MPLRDGTFRQAVARAGLRWDRVKLAAKARLHLFGDVEVVAYRSHGTRDSLRVVGRVVESREVEKPDEEAGLIRNIRNTYHRFQSDEIPDARIRATLGAASVEEQTDHEGFFELRLVPEAPLEPGWHDVEIELLDSIAGGAGFRTTAPVLVPRKDAEFLVVSDLDDTVIRTNATDRLTQIRLMLSRSAREHTPMPGASALYRELQCGADGSGENPFFYISMSGWGLYDLFTEFLDHHGMPIGPLMLQDLAIIEPKSSEMGNESHKRSMIGRLIEDYPDLPLVLIGDSGQEDPETYLDLVRDHGDRVCAVLIRDVTPPERDRQVRQIVDEIERLGVAAAAAESSVSMARAAADFDLIQHDGIGRVRRSMVSKEQT